MPWRKSAYQFEIHFLSFLLSGQNLLVGHNQRTWVSSFRLSKYLTVLYVYISVSMNIAYERFFIFGRLSSFSSFYAPSPPPFKNPSILPLLWFLGKCSNILFIKHFILKLIFCYDVIVDTHAVVSINTDIQ